MCLVLPFPRSPPSDSWHSCLSLSLRPRPPPSFTRSFTSTFLRSTALSVFSASLCPFSPSEPLFRSLLPSVTHCYGYVLRSPSHPHLYSIIYKLPPWQILEYTLLCSALQLTRPRDFASYFSNAFAWTQRNREICAIVNKRVGNFYSTEALLIIRVLKPWKLIAGAFGNSSRRTSF